MRNTDDWVTIRDQELPKLNMTQLVKVLEKFRDICCISILHRGSTEKPGILATRLSLIIDIVAEQPSGESIPTGAASPTFGWPTLRSAILTELGEAGLIQVLGDVLEEVDSMTDNERPEDQSAPFCASLVADRIIGRAVASVIRNRFPNGKSGSDKAEATLKELGITSEQLAEAYRVAADLETMKPPALLNVLGHLRKAYIDMLQREMDKRSTAEAEYLGLEALELAMQRATAGPAEASLPDTYGWGKVKDFACRLTQADLCRLIGEVRSYMVTDLTHGYSPLTEQTACKVVDPAILKAVTLDYGAQLEQHAALAPAATDDLNFPHLREVVLKEFTDDEKVAVIQELWKQLTVAMHLGAPSRSRDKAHADATSMTASAMSQVYSRRFSGGSNDSQKARIARLKELGLPVD